MVRQLEGLIRQQQDRQAALIERKELASRELRQLEEQREGLHGEASTVRLSLSELEALETEAGQLLAEVEAELEIRKNAGEEAESALRNARAGLAEGRARVAGAEAVLEGYDARREEIRGRLERLQDELQALCQTRGRVQAATRRARGPDARIAQWQVGNCGAPNRNRSIAFGQARTRCTARIPKSTRSARRSP